MFKRLQYGALYGALGGLLGGMVGETLFTAVQMFLTQLSSIGPLSPLQIFLACMGALPLLVVGLFYGSFVGLPLGFAIGLGGGLLLALTPLARLAPALGAFWSLGMIALYAWSDWQMPTAAVLPNLQHSFDTIEVATAVVCALLAGCVGGWYYRHQWEQLSLRGII